MGSVRLKNMICWICDCNLAHFEYAEKKLLDEEGNKPCAECIREDAELSELTDEELQ